MGLQNKILVAICLTTFFLIIGTIGYFQLEGFTLLDAFYMTVITISTVGFGEINQLTGVGRIFTIFLILSGVGSVAFAAHAFTESLIDRASNPYSRKKAMKKKIGRLRGHYIICGHGRMGAAAANHFEKMGVDFVVIEASETEAKFLEEDGYHVILGDATSEKSLLSAGIKKADALLALLDSDPENLFTVLTARELNPTLTIIGRTEVASSESRILRAGADSVISPYASAGKRVADKILSATRETLVQKKEKEKSVENCWWFNVEKDSDIASQSVAVISEKLSMKIIGVRRNGKDVLLPADDFLVEVCDELYVSDISDNGVEEQEGGDQKRIILVDDNPVIRRLYTRLFQKAGYHIQTAENGKKGLEMILTALPDAAVIDYMLPDISGLEICRRIREDSSGDNIRLVLFTADEQDETKRKAVKAGVETVVVKSSDASEIISSVQQTLIAK